VQSEALRPPGPPIAVSAPAKVPNTGHNKQQWIVTISWQDAKWNGKIYGATVKGNVQRTNCLGGRLRNIPGKMFRGMYGGNVQITNMHALQVSM